MGDHLVTRNQTGFSTSACQECLLAWPTMSPSPNDDVRLLHASFRRIRSGFAVAFYDRFLASDPRIAALFAHTDLRRQQELLVHGVLMLLDFSAGISMGAMAMQRLADMHVRIGVHGWMYDRWTECLLAVVAELDPDADDHLLTLWRGAMTGATDRMLALVPHQP
jgi:hemoglobin-like flavoprotein